MKTCNKCGNEVGDNAKFCPKCGTEFQTVRKKTPKQAKPNAFLFSILSF